MIKTKAIFGSGVLQPLEPLPLKEHQTVDLTIDDASLPLDALTDWEYMDECLAGSPNAVSLAEVRVMMNTIPGRLSDSVRSLREESRY